MPKFRKEIPDMTIRRLLALAVVLLMGGVAAAHGQSLADLAAKEEARRKQTKKPAKVYTNKDVKGGDRTEAPAPAGAAPAGSTAPATAAAGEPAGAQEPPKEDAATAEGESEKPKTDEEARADDEKKWRARMTEAREALERNEVFAQALQSQINALQADFVSRDDPAQRSLIEQQRKKSLAQLDRVKAEIVTLKKAIADIEEEARRAGVPPGWLR
jgi:hypothetical protein